jgi:hypothetical protein
MVTDKKLNFLKKDSEVLMTPAIRAKTIGLSASEIYLDTEDRKTPNIFEVLLFSSLTILVLMERKRPIENKILAYV